MKMNKHILPAVCLLLGACLLGSCAKSDTGNTNETAARYLKAWMDIHYPSAVEKDGVFVVEDTPGTGSLWDESLETTFATYTVRELDGTVSANTDEDWARQLGTWDQTYYYGQQVLVTGDGLSYAGVDAILKGMRVGGTRTAIVPSWMMTVERYDDVEEYKNHETSSSTSSAIYTIKLLGQTDNLVDYEFQMLSDYARKTWNVTDTLSSGPIFFKSFTQFDEEPEDMPTDTTVYINYTGRRISDGQVFDTTIADTAKFYHIYNPSKTYEPVSITWSSEVSELKMDGSSNLIDGFKYGLYAMHPEEKASFAFGFSLGYGTKSSGSLIPSYAALRFDIEMVPKP